MLSLVSILKNATTNLRSRLQSGARRGVGWRVPRIALLTVCTVGAVLLNFYLEISLENHVKSNVKRLKWPKLFCFVESSAFICLPNIHLLMCRHGP